MLWLHVEQKGLWFDRSTHLRWAPNDRKHNVLFPLCNKLIYIYRKSVNKCSQQQLKNNPILENMKRPYLMMIISAASSIIERKPKDISSPRKVPPEAIEHIHQRRRDTASIAKNSPARQLTVTLHRSLQLQNVTLWKEENKKIGETQGTWFKWKSAT